RFRRAAARSLRPRLPRGAGRGGARLDAAASRRYQQRSVRRNCMLKKIVIGVLVFVVVLYGGLIAYLYVNQRGFFFNPAGETFDPAAVGLDAEIVAIPTTGGETITGWYAPSDENMPAILYLKGNTGSFSAEYERFLAFTEAGYGFLSVDYRGFPLSPGGISQDNILADALAAFDWLSQREAATVG